MREVLSARQLLPVACSLLTAACYESHVRDGLEGAVIEERIREECGELCSGRVISVAVSEGAADFSCALYDTGGVVCWGLVRGSADDPDELWDPETRRTLYQKLPPKPVDLPLAEEIAAGPAACARTREGVVYCWGPNAFGGVGDGTRERRKEPVRILEDGAVASMYAGGGTCVVLEDGRVRVWGWGIDGRDDTRPTPVDGISDAIGCAVGSHHLCVLHRTGSVSCRGYNDRGQLGDPELSDFSGELVPVPGLAEVSQIAAGEATTCALRVDGAVQCWGVMRPREGAGRPTVAPSPQPIPGLVDVVQLSMGYGGRYCAVRATGQVACWGVNDGWLGIGPGPDPSVYATWELLPRDLPGLEDAVHVSIGAFHGCAVTAAGRVYCWGQNAWGQGGYDDELYDCDLRSGRCGSHVPLPVIGLP